MNLGQQDYQVLTTLFQENLKESESYTLIEGNSCLLLCYNSQSVGKWVLNYYRHVDSNDNIFP